MLGMEGDMIDLAVLDPVDAGGKAAGVRWLLRHGARVPRSWGVPYATVERVANGGSLASPSDQPLAVRSSANREDGHDCSLAGQLTSVMEVRPDELSDAIREVHASAGADAVKQYLESVPGEPLRVGVLVQEMIPPVVSGVSFSRNPVTGLNEVIVEAVEGSGEQLVQGGITPDRWVRRWGSWTESPDDSRLPAAVAMEIADQTIRLAEAFGRPADLEWVWDGTDIWWVQIRPIVGIDDIAVYSNRISREVLPGLVKPLVWSVNVPVVNGAWIRLITQAVGPNDLVPADLARQFAYRAYFNMGTMGRIFEELGMPRDLLEVLMGLDGDEKPSFKPSVRTMRHLPRMAMLAGRLLRHGRTAPAAIARLRRQYAEIPDHDLAALGRKALLQRANDVMALTEDAAYLNIVTPLLANLWAGRLRSALRKHGVDPVSVDITDGHPSPHDPTSAMQTLSSLLHDRPPAAEATDPDVAQAVASFLARFGHFSDSGNDFSVPTWKDHPAPLLDALREGQVERRGTSLAEVLRDPSRSVRKKQRRAVHHQHLRDEVSSLYTAGYGRLRPIMLEVGSRLVEDGLLREREDVFFATLAELGEIPADLTRRVADRQEELRRVDSVAMPETIFGDNWEPITVADSDQLTGLATSTGQHRGTARVVSGLGEGDSVRHGDVLVIPFSDVGWTPLFLRAGAVVSESGGMLAHASILARELGIPCVVSVEGAMAIPDGATVWVDGLSGVITVER